MFLAVRVWQVFSQKLHTCWVCSLHGLKGLNGTLCNSSSLRSIVVWGTEVVAGDYLSLTKNPC